MRFVQSMFTPGLNLTKVALSIPFWDASTSHVVPKAVTNFVQTGAGARFGSLMHNFGTEMVPSPVEKVRFSVSSVWKIK